MPLYRICLYFAFFRYLAIGRVVKCVEDERLRKLLKAADVEDLRGVRANGIVALNIRLIDPDDDQHSPHGRETFF